MNLKNVQQIFVENIRSEKRHKILEEANSY